MEIKTRYKSGLIKRKSNFSQKLCAKEERNAIFKKIASILQKSDIERTSEDKDSLISYADIVLEVQQRLHRRSLVKSRLQEIEEPLNTLKDKCMILSKAILRAQHLVIYTGAGISTAARIPDYRGTNGIWTRLQQGKDIGNHDLSLAEPTYTHMALSTLYSCGFLKYVVSQNCDGLHLRSGLPRIALSELHGNMLIEVCKNCKPNREYWRLFDVTENTARYSHKTSRRCYFCNNTLIDTIVHFGERGTLQWPLNWSGACKNADKADVIICIGSSLKVLKKYPWLWQMDKPVKKRPELYIINLQWTPKDDCALLKINGKCDVIMNIIMNILKINVPMYNRKTDPIFSHATRLSDVEVHTKTQPELKDFLDENLIKFEKESGVKLKSECSVVNDKNEIIENNLLVDLKYEPQMDMNCVVFESESELLNVHKCDEIVQTNFKNCSDSHDNYETIVQCKCKKGNNHHDNCESNCKSKVLEKIKPSNFNTESSNVIEGYDAKCLNNPSTNSKCNELGDKTYNLFKKNDSLNSMNVNSLRVLESVDCKTDETFNLNLNVNCDLESNSNCSAEHKIKLHSLIESTDNSLPSNLFDMKRNVNLANSKINININETSKKTKSNQKPEPLVKDNIFAMENILNVKNDNQNLNNFENNNPISYKSIHLNETDFKCIEDIKFFKNKVEPLKITIEDKVTDDSIIYNHTKIQNLLHYSTENGVKLSNSFNKRNHIKNKSESDDYNITLFNQFSANTVFSNFNTDFEAIMKYYRTFFNSVNSNQLPISPSYYPYQTSFLYPGLHSIINPDIFAYDDRSFKTPQNNSYQHSVNKQTEFSINNQREKDCNKQSQSNSLMLYDENSGFVCKYCNTNYKSNVCLFYTQYEPVFKQIVYRYSKTLNKKKRIYCECCDYSSSDDDINFEKLKSKQSVDSFRDDLKTELKNNCEENEDLNSTVTNSYEKIVSEANLDFDVKINNSCVKIQPGWFGKGYRKTKRYKKW